jgi:hypothetical protein
MGHKSILKQTSRQEMAMAQLFLAVKNTLSFVAKLVILLVLVNSS